MLASSLYNLQALYKFNSDDFKELEHEDLFAQSVDAEKFPDIFPRSKNEDLRNNKVTKLRKEYLERKIKEKVG